MTEPALSPDDLERSLRRNIVAGSFGMVWMTVAIGMPLPLLMEAIGATGVQLGLLAGAWQFAMLAQVASALGTEVFARRKPFWAGISLVHRILWLAPCVVPLLLPRARASWPLVIIAAVACSNILGQAGTALWQSWMADLIPPERAGRFWGVRQRCLSLSLMVSALVYGVILDRCPDPEHPLRGFQIVFAIATVTGLADILIHCTVFEPAPFHIVEVRTLAVRISAPLRQPGFVRFTLAMGVWTGACAMLGYNMGMPGFFSMVYLKEHFGASYSQAALVFVAAGLGAALWTPRIGHLIDRWGGRRVILGLIAGGPVLMLAWLGGGQTALVVPFLKTPLPHAVVLLAGVSLVLSGLYSGMWVCQVRLTQALTTAAGRTIAMGLHWSIVGTVGSLGPLFAGWMKDHYVHAALPWGLTYYGLLVLLHVLLAWGVAFPLVYGLPAAVTSPLPTPDARHRDHPGE